MRRHLKINMPDTLSVKLLFEFVRLLPLLTNACELWTAAALLDELFSNTYSHTIDNNQSVQNRWTEKNTSGNMYVIQYIAKLSERYRAHSYTQVWMGNRQTIIAVQSRRNFLNSWKSKTLKWKGICPRSLYLNTVRLKYRCFSFFCPLLLLSILGSQL